MHWCVTKCAILNTSRARFPSLHGYDQKWVFWALYLNVTQNPAKIETISWCAEALHCYDNQLSGGKSTPSAKFYNLQYFICTTTSRYERAPTQAKCCGCKSESVLRLIDIEYQRDTFLLNKRIRGMNTGYSKKKKRWKRKTDDLLTQNLPPKGALHDLQVDAGMQGMMWAYLLIPGQSERKETEEEELPPVENSRKAPVQTGHPDAHRIPANSNSDSVTRMQRPQGPNPKSNQKRGPSSFSKPAFLNGASPRRQLDSG